MCCKFLLTLATVINPLYQYVDLIGTPYLKNWKLIMSGVGQKGYGTRLEIW